MVDPCEVCHKAVRDGIKEQPECSECNVTHLMPQNIAIYGLCQAILSGLIVRYSEQSEKGIRLYRGVDWGTIDVALTRYQIQPEAWEHTIEKILAFAGVIIEQEVKEATR